MLHRPGHSPSDTVFWDEQRRILIAADHLIKHISSNPLISRPLGDASATRPAHRPQALVTYLESLRKTRELPAEIVLSGHGDPITDHVALIDERFEFHRRRADKIHGLIAERPAHRLRARPGAVRRHRGHAGLPDAVRGARPRRPAAERGPRARGRARRRRLLRGDQSSAQPVAVTSRPGGCAILRAADELNDHPRGHPTRAAATARARRVPGTKLRMLLIVNPRATTVSSRLKNLVVYALRGRYDVDAVETQGRNHATELTREAVGEANTTWWSRSAVTAPSTRPRTASPARTCRSRSCPAAARTSSAACSASRPTSWTRPSTCSSSPTSSCRGAIDLGRVNGRYFVFSSGVGLDADATRWVDERPTIKARGGVLTFTYAATAAFFRDYRGRPPRLCRGGGRARRRA